MILVHVISGLNIGGAERMLFRLLLQLRRINKDISIHVISLSDVGQFGRAIESLGIQVHALHLKKAFLFPLALFRLFLILKKIRPDILQTWMVHSDLLGGLAARLAGVRLIIWGVRTTDYSVESFSTRSVRWVCARLSGVVPARIVCAAQASLVNSQAAGYAADKLMVIPNGFDVAQLLESLGAGHAIREKLCLESGTCVLGCLGRYNPAKDYANFVAAAGVLASRFPQVRFLMVGRGLDTGNPELMQWIEATGFPERFILFGERSDPAVCLAAMDVFVLSSCTEGFPNALGEAMSMGLACVSTDVGDASLLMGNDEWLVPPRDPKALADKLAQLLILPVEERKRIGMKARQRVVECFSMTATAQQFLSLYLTLSKDG